MTEHDNNGELIALQAGISDGWWELDHESAGRTTGEAKKYPNPLTTVWGEGHGRACVFFQTAQCRAAYIGGWAIGVQRFIDGLDEDGLDESGVEI